jgi:hypothetical protein
MMYSQQQLRAKILQGIIRCDAARHMLPALTKTLSEPICFYAHMVHVLSGGPGGGLVRLRQPGGSNPKLLQYDGGLSVKDQANFTSHGFDIDYDSRRIVSADYVVVASTVIQTPQPPLG